MKQIKTIDGSRRLYDTDTAKKLASWQSDYGRSDFRWYRETLYKKRNGELFLYGEGNGLSQYAKPYGDSYGPGAKITPISLERAKDLVQQHLGADDYEKLFGDVSEDGGKVALSLQVPAKLSHELDEYVANHISATKTSTIIQALTEFLSKQK